MTIIKNLKMEYGITKYKKTVILTTMLISITVFLSYNYLNYLSHVAKIAQQAHPQLITY